MSNKNVSTATVAARLPLPEKRDAESLVTLTNQQIAAVMACTDYPNQPTVQAVIKSLQTDNNSLDATVGDLGKARSAVPPLEAKRNVLMATVRRGRHSLAGALTTVCAGVPATIKAWGATPGPAATPTPTSTVAPTDLTATPNKKASGTVDGKCTRVLGAAAYFWSLSSDPTTPVPNPIMTTRLRVSIPGQVVGHVMYLRVSVLRRHGGQSAWSEAVQITVR
jgi:hypothetical protein